MLNIYEQTIDYGNGRTVTIETGKLAKQADGAAVVKMGKTMLLATVVSAKEAKEDVDFMPLSVDYREKFASSGRFPGGFLKRESRPSDYEILISRLVDRALRPLFPSDYHAETFVNITLVSAEKDIMPDALAGLAASAALMVSDIPFNGPISEARVARINGEFILNPTFQELEQMDIDIMIGATMENILMVEGEMKEVSEKDMIDAINFGHENIKKQCQAQLELAKKVNKEVRAYEHEKNDEELKQKIFEAAKDKIYEVVKSDTAKKERSDKFDDIKNELIEKFCGEDEELNPALVSRYFGDVEKEVVREYILDNQIRLDGRKTDEIRPIWTEIDTLPAAHGSAIFTRGETQSLTSITLGTKLDEQTIDEVLIQGSEKFVLHYNFPPFSTGDARPIRGVGRREIGHGNLAHRALKNIMPDVEDNPYAVRVVSDILESNGSSSMATVCAASLALMDAGVRFQKTVSGIAMGLITDEKAANGDFKNGKYAILSDILGDEDHLGDMDFKVAGTRDGITACQMDIKVNGLSDDIMMQALEQAKKGRLHILEEMEKTINAPREDIKAHAPRIVQVPIPKEMVGAVIGPGGQVVQDIQNKTGATLVIEDVQPGGISATVTISAENKDVLEAAINRVQAIIEVPEPGKTYTGKVKTITSYGAFVEIIPNKTGLLHISELDWKHIRSVEDVLKEGDEVEVKLVEIDNRSGKMTLSRKALLPKPDNYQNKGKSSKT
jgi:polyribonucleotide nucleotidyltransferase